MIEEDTNSSAHHHALTSGGLVSKTEAGREVVPVGRENGIDAISLNEQPLTGDKDGEVLAQTMERPDVLVAKPKVDI